MTALGPRSASGSWAVATGSRSGGAWSVAAYGASGASSGSPSTGRSARRAVSRLTGSWPPVSSMRILLPRQGRPESAGAGVAAGQDVGQVEFDRPLQLLVGAGLGVAVVAPAPELGGVAEPPALHVVVGDLDDQLGGERLEGRVLLGVPARHHRPGGPLGGGPAGPGVVVVRAQPVGGELVQELAAPLHRERRVGK